MLCNMSDSIVPEANSGLQIQFASLALILKVIVRSQGHPECADY